MPLVSGVPSFNNIPSEATTPFSSNPPEVFRSTSHSPPPDETHDRNTVAEAAMRRLGIRVQPSAQAEASASTKGKEPERDRFEQAFLAPPTLPPPHPQSSLDEVDERLQRLRAVDQTIQTLIEELTQLKRDNVGGSSTRGARGGVMDEPGITARPARGSDYDLAFGSGSGS